MSLQNLQNIVFDRSGLYLDNQPHDSMRALARWGDSNVAPITATAELLVQPRPTNPIPTPIALAPKPAPVIHVAPRAATRLSLWWILAAAMVFASIRSAVVLTAVPSFSSREDLDKLVSWQEESTIGTRSRLEAAYLRLINSTSNVGASAGHRVNLAITMLASAVLPMRYSSIKILAILTGAATLAAFLWALRSAISPATAALLTLTLVFAPIRLFVQSGLFTGNHVELMLFVALAIGFGIRGLAATLRWRRDGSFVGLGLISGIALYYCQSMWLWCACLGLVLGVMLTTARRPLNQWLSALAAFGTGLLPGALIIYKAFWPSQMMMLLPYGRSPDAYEWRFERLNLPYLSHLVEEMMLPFRNFKNPIEQAIGVIGASVWWLAAAAVLLLFVRRRALRLTGCSLLLFVAGYTVISAVGDLTSSRHRMPIVISTVLLQCLVLGEFLPELLERWRPSVRRRVTWAGFAFGAVLIAPRAQEDLALASRHTLADGVAYDTTVVMAIGLNSMEPRLSKFVQPKLADIETMSLDRTERGILLEGMRWVFASGEEAVDTDHSLPRSLIYGEIDLNVMREHTAQGIAHGQHFEAIEMMCDGPQPISAGDSEEELFLCGVATALEAIDAAQSPAELHRAPELQMLAAVLP